MVLGFIRWPLVFGSANLQPEIKNHKSSTIPSTSPSSFIGIHEPRLTNPVHLGSALQMPNSTCYQHITTSSQSLLVEIRWLKLAGRHIRKPDIFLKFNPI